MTNEQILDAAPPRSRSRLAIGSVVFGQLMLQADGVIVTVALPHIREQFDLDPATLSWVVTAYSLAFAGLLLVSGRIGTRIGARAALIIGTAVFIAASAAGGFAPDGAVLIVARCVQGAGAALAGPAVLVLLNGNTEPGPQRLRAQSLFVMASSVGSAIGLIGGGVLTVTLGWRWVMFINVPVGILVIAGALAFVRESERRIERLDVPGALLSIIAMVALVFGFTRAADVGWASPTPLASFAIAIVAIAALVPVERRAAFPVIPGRLLAGVRQIGAYLGMLLLPIAMFSYFYFATLLYQDALGFSALRTGLSFLPFTAAVLIGGALAPRVVGAIGERATATLGVALAAAGLSAFAILAPGDRSGLAGLPPAFVLGFGPPLFFTVGTARIMSSAPIEDAGAAASLLQSFQQLGAAVGIAGLTTVFVSALPTLGRSESIALALFAAVAVAVVLIAVSLATRAYPGRIRG